MDSSALLLTGWSSLCQRPSCTLLFTAFMKLKLIYTLREFVSSVFYSKWEERCEGDRALRIQWSLQVVKGGYVSHGSRRMPPKLCIQHQLSLQPE